MKGRQFLFYYYYTDAFNLCIIMIDLGLGKAIDKASNFLDLIYIASSMDVGFWKNMIGVSDFITFCQIFFLSVYQGRERKFEIINYTIGGGGIVKKRRVVKETVFAEFAW